MKPTRVPLFEEGLAAACMALLALITLANVLTRYITDQSVAWTEEISIFLLVLMTLAGASAAAARDRHIRIEIFYDSGSARRRQGLKVFAACFSALVFAVLALLFGRVVADEVHFAETTMGLGVPRWWYTVFTPIVCVLITLRCAGVAWRTARAGPAGVEPPEATP